MDLILPCGQQNSIFKGGVATSEHPFSWTLVETISILHKLKSLYLFNAKNFI